MDLTELAPWRFVPVVLLLGTAAALLHRAGEPPPALRGLKRLLERTSPNRPDAPSHPPAERIPLWRRLLAFLLVLASFLLAVGLPPF